MNETIINAVARSLLSERGVYLLKKYLEEINPSEREIRDILENVKEFNSLEQLSSIVGKKKEYMAFVSPYESKKRNGTYPILPDNKARFIRENIATLPNVKIIFLSSEMKVWNDRRFNREEEYFLIVMYHQTADF